MYALLNLAFTDLVHEGISEKVALAVTYVAAFIVGQVLAYVKSWRLALSLTFSLIPSIGMTGALMNKFVSAYKQYVWNFLAATSKSVS